MRASGATVSAGAQAMKTSKYLRLNAARARRPARRPVSMNLLAWRTSLPKPSTQVGVRRTTRTPFHISQEPSSVSEAAFQSISRTSTSWPAATRAWASSVVR